MAAPMKYAKATLFTIEGLAWMLGGSLAVRAFLDHFPIWFGITVDDKTRAIALGVVILTAYLYSSRKVLKELRAIRTDSHENA